jgi:hypothetical protein
MNREEMCVSVFLVGAPKCGTTTLVRYLDEQPKICFSSPKEANYFSGEEIKRQGLYYAEPVVNNLEDYCALFKEADDILYGDGSVSYLYYPNVAKKIYAYNPSAKIIAIVRNPIDRAFSHYLMDKRLGYVRKAFDEIFRNPSEYKNHYQQYFSLGLYAEQLARYIEVFGRDNVKVYSSHELRDSPENVLKDVCVFLGLSDDVYMPTTRAHNEYKAPNNWLIAKLYKMYSMRALMRRLLPPRLQSLLKNLLFSKSGKPQLEPAFRRELQEFYRNDVERLSLMLGKDYPLEWLK